MGPLETPLPNGLSIADRWGVTNHLLIVIILHHGNLRAPPPMPTPPRNKSLTPSSPNQAFFLGRGGIGRVPLHFHENRGLQSKKNPILKCAPLKLTARSLPLKWMVGRQLLSTFLLGRLFFLRVYSSFREGCVATGARFLDGTDLPLRKTLYGSRKNRFEPRNIFTKTSSPVIPRDQNAIELPSRALSCLCNPLHQTTYWPSLLTGFR